jgi:hypothetical protein
MSFFKKESNLERIVKTIIKSERDVLLELLEAAEEKGAKAKVDLKGVKLNIRGINVKMDGQITVTVEKKR